MSPTIAISLSIVLVVANAFFVGASFAVVSARRSQIEPLADAGARGATSALWAMEHVSLMLATSQLGITVCSLGLGAVAEPAIAQLLVGPAEAVGLPERWVHPIALVFALLIVVYVHIVAGEMIPKNVAIAGPERAVLWLAGPLVVVARMLAIPIRLLRGITRKLVQALHVEPKEELSSTYTAQEVHSIVVHSREEGLLADQHNVVGGALTLGQRNAAQVMVPMNRLVTVSSVASAQEVEHEVARTGYSRFPVIDQNTGTLAGYLHVKDLLDVSPETYERPLGARWLRPLAQVSSSDTVDAMLAALRRSGAHVAQVCAGPDEPSVGVVFLEDVLEELVGEVRDAAQRDLRK